MRRIRRWEGRNRTRRKPLFKAIMKPINMEKEIINVLYIYSLFLMYINKTSYLLNINKRVTNT